MGAVGTVARTGTGGRALKDMTGQRFGRLTVIGRDWSAGSRAAKLLCKCDCGQSKSVRWCCLSGGTASSCGCLARECTSARRRKNLIGAKFGRLTVTCFAGVKYASGAAMWRCLCECGKTTVVASSNLSRSTSSCGCLARESASRMGVQAMKRAGKRWLYEHGTKRINMRSSWEVVFARWLDDNVEPWEYEPRTFTLTDSMRYVPDFYLPSRDIWVEVKGFMTLRSAKKIETFRMSRRLVLVGNDFIMKIAGVCTASELRGLVKRAGSHAAGQLRLF